MARSRAPAEGGLKPGIELRVHPTLIPTRRLIANVEGPMNAVWVRGDAVGETLYYGQGAGSFPTASAVVADLVDVARTLAADPDHECPIWLSSLIRLVMRELPMAETETAYYLRLRVADEPGVLADITRFLADAGISLESVLQPAPDAANKTTSVILLTHRTVERQMDQAIDRIQALGSVIGEIVRIRLEDLT